MSAEIEDTEYVTITSREYASLLESQEWLNALKDAGVDNWPGIDEAYYNLEECRLEDWRYKDG